MRLCSWYMGSTISVPLSTRWRNVIYDQKGPIIFEKYPYPCPLFFFVVAVVRIVSVGHDESRTKIERSGSSRLTGCLQGDKEIQPIHIHHI